MGKDYEILEEQYQKLVADKAAAEGRDDLSDPERENIVAGFDRAISSLEESIVDLGRKAKQEIMDAIHGLEEKMAVNNEFIEKSKARIEELQAMIAEEEGKGEAGDKDKIRIYQAEIKGIEKEMRVATRAINAAKREIKENNKKLIPIMNIFKDKGVFEPDEIDSLTKLEKRIERAKKNFGPKDDPVVGGDDTTVPGGDDTTTPGGDDTTVPGGDDTTVPGGDDTTVPGGDDTTTPGGDDTTTPGGDDTTTPGGDDTTVPGGDDTTVPGGSSTTTPGGSSTTTPGGSRTAPGGDRTVASAAAPTVEEPVELSMEEFNSIYRLAKEKQLSEVHIKKLLPILSDPKAYTKYGITTGIFRNKAKVLFTAMGDYMAKGYRTPIAQVASVYGIDPKQDFGEGVVPSAELTSWRGIKALASKPTTRTKAEAIYAKVVEAGDARIAEGGELRGEDERLYLLAKKELGRMETFRSTLETHKKVVARRRFNPIAWLTGGDKFESLPEAPEVDSRSSAVRDSVRADIDRVGRDAVEDYDRTMRGAGIMAVLASESADTRSHTAPTEGTDTPVVTEGTDEVVVEVIEEGTETPVVPTTTDMIETLSAGVYPPEEIDTSVGERTTTEAPEITTFDGPGIDG